MTDQSGKPKKEMTRCPECDVPVRIDRLEKHIKRVHKARETLPTWKEGGPDISKNTRICPNCGGSLNNSHWKKHIISCPKRSGSGPFERRPADGPPPKALPYIIDEFGVVQSYDTWWRNQNLAKAKMLPVQAGCRRNAPGNVRNSTSGKSMTSCPKYGSKVRPTNLEKHMKKVHGENQ